MAQQPTVMLNVRLAPELKAELDRLVARERKYFIRYDGRQASHQYILGRLLAAALPSEHAKLDERQDEQPELPFGAPPPILEEQAEREELADKERNVMKKKTATKVPRSCPCTDEKTGKNCGRAAGHEGLHANGKRRWRSSGRKRA